MSKLNITDTMDYKVPMNLINQHLTEEEIAEFSKRGYFDYEDPFFHYDKNEKFIESFNEADMYFAGVELKTWGE